MAKRSSTPSFILELPLATGGRSKAAKQLRSRFEAARNLYNACLGEAKRRLNAMRSSPEWQVARAIPSGDKHKTERREAYVKARTTLPLFRV
jgi:hypothetical protein